MSNLPSHIRIVQIIVKSIVGLISLSLFYFLLCLILPLMTVNNDRLIKTTGILMYVGGDGMHTDIIVPVKNEICNWDDYINNQDFGGELNMAEFISFGFAEKDFYLRNRSWQVINYGTALKAGLGIGSSIMHVGVEGEYPFKRRFCRKIYLSKEQYSKLVSFIKSSFTQNDGTKLNPLPIASYRNAEKIYNSSKSFNLFHTCNTWTNECLKTISFKTGKWTALEQGIRDQFIY
ncbi:MAG: TIGR02117 family protein [Bacteroidetes bacterium]|nr:TIGR02117 family protein [Bacteroidota bacterium]